MTKKLCKDQKKDFVVQLKSLFQGKMPEEIDEAVSEAQKQNDVETIEERKKVLAKMFDTWMETFKVVNCPKSITDIFLEKKEEAVKKMSEIWTERYAEETPKSLASKGIYLGIPVTPRIYMGTHGLMSMVRNKDKIGYAYLDPNEITNSENVPSHPYIIYDVEDGRVTLGKTAEEAEVLIKNQSRLCHISDEDIAVCIQTDTLSHHYLLSTGSRYERDGRVPSVYLNDDEPELDWDYLSYSNDEWGSASCRERS